MKTGAHALRRPRSTGRGGKVKGWHRRLWGVEFRGAFGDRLSILSTGWHDGGRPAAYAGEPTRPLLFTTRAAARAWCQAKRARYANRTDVCRAWRFRPIKVRERLAVVMLEKIADEQTEVGQ